MYKLGPHCNGCNQNCDIYALSFGCIVIGDTRVHCSAHDNTYDFGLNLCKLCVHYDTQTDDKKTFELKSDIRCNGCAENCKITCDPKKQFWVKIGNMRTPGTHVSEHAAMLHGLNICRMCKHNKTK